MNLELDIRWPGGGRLARDYFAGEPAATGLYAHAWSDPDALERRLAELDDAFTDERRAAAAHVLRTSNPGAAAVIDDWERERGLVVTTGQQPGLFTGPMLAVNKALSAVVLAERWGARLGRPVLPVFWVASEDHDWEESCHTWMLDTANEPVRLEAVPEHPPAGRPLSRIPLIETDELIRAVEALLPPNDFRAGLLDGLQEAYPAGATLPDGFERLLRSWLGEFGLLIVRADDPALKEASLPVLRTELERGADFEPALRSHGQTIEERGYALQVPVLENALNLFVEGPGGRERLYRSAAGFHLHTSGTDWSPDELERRWSEDPSIMSPNVFLRPVVESAVFPVLAYLAGPGETAYYAQLRPLYAGHGVAMPIIHPRISITVVEPKVRKVLDKVGVSIAELARPEHELASDLARDEMPDEARAALGRLRGEIGTRTGELLDAVKAIDPTLKGPIAHARNTAFQALAEAEKKIVQSIKREQQIVLEQVAKARHNLMPNGKPQERVLTPLQFLSRYGMEFFGALRAAAAAALEPGGSLASGPGKE